MTPKDSLPFVASLVASLDLFAFGPLILNSSVLQSFRWCYRILILNLTRNKIHLRSTGHQISRCWSERPTRCWSERPIPSRAPTIHAAYVRSVTNPEPSIFEPNCQRAASRLLFPSKFLVVRFRDFPDPQLRKYLTTTSNFEAAHSLKIPHHYKLTTAPSLLYLPGQFRLISLMSPHDSRSEAEKQQLPRTSGWKPDNAQLLVSVVTDDLSKAKKIRMPESLRRCARYDRVNWARPLIQAQCLLLGNFSFSDALKTRFTTNLLVYLSIEDQWRILQKMM